MTILMGLLPSMMVYAQTYTVSPSGYTSVPSSNVTQGSRTFHGNLLQAKATVSGQTATFTLKKQDGSKFQNSGTIVVKNDSYDGTTVKSNIRYDGGIYNPTVDVDLDFTSGSKTYVITIKSGDIFYYTNPITIKASSSSSQTADLALASTPSFGTTILTKGKTYTFTVKVKNNGSSSWKGAFYLKSGSTNWISMSSTIKAGETATLTDTYTPTTTGTHTLKFYYQTGGTGDGVLVPTGSYSNPIYVNVVDDSSPSDDGDYTVSPSGYTSVPSSNVTQGSRTFYGNLLQAKATVSGQTATFTLKKQDGSKFQNSGTIVVKNDSYDGTTVKSNIRYDGGIYNPTVDVDLDFTSGSKTYVITIKSGDIFYYTNPITIKASSSSSQTADLALASTPSFGTTILTKGKTYTFTVKVKNNGSSSWKGAFYLKSGSTNWISMSSTIKAGETATLTDTYTPTTTGTHTLKFYYQTGGTGDGVLVPTGSYSNPIYVNVVDDSSPSDDGDYAVAPSGYTSVPTSNLKLGSTTFHGNLLQAKATVSGSKATFTLRKKDGSAFQNSGTYVIRYDSYSGQAAKTNIKIESGSTNPSTDLDLDFTSGSKKYVITLKSGDIYYYTNPITITASSSLLATQTANLVLASSLSFSTNGQTVSTLTKGQTYTFSVKVKNTGETAWKGAFYLKNGSENLLSWGGQSIAAGSTITLTDTYRPQVTGSMSLDFFYQTGGKGSGILVNSGNYKNPLTISMDAPLATPDKNTFKTADVTETSFTASWGSISGADCYDILVKKASDEDYSNYVFKRATSRTYISVTDLTPGTSYQFQIRARNSDNGNSSNWSSSNPTPVKTMSSGSEIANLSILSVQGVDGSTPLTVGETVHYSALVVNDGSSRWNGSLYLKDGKNNIKGWYSISLPSGVAQRFECDYTPDAKGSKSLVLYYQTGGRGDGIPVNAGKAKNPMTISVISDPSINNELTLKTVMAYPATLEFGKKGTVTAQVQNNGDTDWYGTLYLTDNNATIASEVNLPAGQSKTISTTAWEPSTTGSHSIAVYYESKNSSNKQLVSANGFANPVYSSVSRKQNDIVGNTVKLKNLTKEVAPQFVTEGSEVYHHYKVTDMNGNPIKGLTAVFSTIGGNSIKVNSNESDDDGIFTLCLKTEGDEAVASPGTSIVFSCIDLIKNDGQHFDIYAPNSNEHDVSLTVLKKSSFENAEKVNLSIDLGLSAKAELTNYLKGKASVSVPLKFGWQFNEDNTFSNYILGIGIKGEVGCTAKLGNTLLKLKGVEVTGKAGIGYESSYQHEEFKPMIWALVYNICNSLPPTTDWLVKYGADVYKAWYEESDIKKPNFTQNGFVNMSFGGKFDYTFDYPTAPGLKRKLARLPQNIGITNFERKGDVAAKWAFNKTKTDMATKETTYCNSTSVKFNVGGDIKRELENDLFNMKSFWWNSRIYDFYQSKILNFLKYKSFDADKDFTLSFKEDEEYSDEAKLYLNKASHEISMTSGYELNVEELELKGGWTPIGGSLRYSNTCSSKVTLGKGFLNYLNTLVINNDKNKDVICAAVPALASTTLISEPQLLFNAWKYDYFKPLTQICIPNATRFSLKESMKVEQTNSSKFGLTVNIPIYDFKIAKLSLDVGAELELENRPSVSYYSVENNRFFPVVLRPATSISGVVKALTNSLTKEYMEESFVEHEESLNDKWTYMNRAQYGTGYVLNDVPLRFTTIDEGHTSILNAKTGGLYEFIKKRSPRLAAEKQEDICTFTFVLNDNIKNFYDDTNLEFSHFYPAGDLLGVTDQGDTLFVVSEVCDLTAMQGTNTLQTTQNGQFKLDTTIGVDDLIPFGFPENTPLDVYYSEKGSNVWRYVGPAGTNLVTDKFGAYMMATSIKNDIMAPEISMNFDEDAELLILHVSDNIGVRTKSLNVYVNGEVKDFNMIDESSFEVQLAPEDMDYRLDVYVSAYDLAGNKADVVQMFNLDKPEKVSIQNQPDTDISQLENTLYIEPVSATAGGEVILSVKMKNKVEAEGFQFDLELPEGVSVAKDADGYAEAYLSTERTTARKTNTFDTAFLGNGLLRVIAGSTNGSTISGNDGEVATIKLKIDNSVAAGSYPIALRNIAISDVNAVSHDVAYVKSTMTIGGGLMGDANGDGVVNVFDVTAMVNYILGTTSEAFVFEAADVNGDGIVNVFDVTKVVNIILGVDTDAKRRGVMATNGTGTMSAVSDGKEMYLVVDDAAQYVAMQFDVVMPEGKTVGNVELNSSAGHMLSYSQMDANRYRVIAYSIQNANFRPTEKALIGMKKATGAKIENAMCVTSDGRCINMNVTDEATGIDAVDVRNERKAIYNLSGQYMGTDVDALPKGIYIRNKQKLYIK